MNMKKMPAIIQDSIYAGPMAPEAPNAANNQPLPTIPVNESMKKSIEVRTLLSLAWGLNRVIHTNRLIISSLLEN